MKTQSNIEIRPGKLILQKNCWTIGILRYSGLIHIYCIFILLLFLLNYLNAQPPSLSFQQQKAGWFEISCDSLKGKEFIIESSSDLKAWNPVFGSKGDVTVFPMLTTDIQNPFQFYRAKLQSPDISTVIISQTNSKPFGLLNINLGNVDVFDNNFSVIFYDNTGCHVKVNAIPLTDNEISVFVPPFFVLTNELSRGSELNIQVIAVSLDSKSYVSGVVKGFVVEPMNVTTNSPGLITMAYINGLKSYSEYLLTNVITNSTNSNLQNLSVGLSNMVYGLNQLKIRIQQVINNSNDVTLGTIGNQPIIINRQVLQILDKEIISILESQCEAIPASSASISVFSSQPKSSNCKDVKTAAEDYINALLHNPDTAADQAECYNKAFSQASVDAVFTGLKVTAGSAGLGISFASLAGVPAAALAMANSALLYVTSEASMGLIAISGILGQSNIMSQVALQRGVEQLNSILIDPIKELLLGKNAGEILNIIENVSSLTDIFLNTGFLAVSPSDIDLGEIGLNPKTASFMINAPDSVSWNIEVSGWGERFMDYELSSHMGSGSQQISITLIPTPPPDITSMYALNVFAFVYCYFYYDGEIIDEDCVMISYDYIFDRDE